MDALARSVPILVIAGLSLLTGCTYTFDIPMDQIPRLSASAPPPRTVKTTHGDTETLRSDSTVTVIPRGMPSMTFEQPLYAEIQGENLVIKGRAASEARQFPLRAIAPLKVKQISEGGSVAAILGVLAGASLIGLTIWGFSSLSSSRLFDH